ncbi:hypothetical protein I7I50_06245 [Histoplasma capsulatum G186AR]|uniref:Uncharacterized protein n=1 Tax=Ajellomyces capsulatus TaxID=5037 RepID=A0A8H8D3B9_AJECA|nr:hypothetical protein I7I52_10682 [Histoplasma capsulatum]QSS67231.1 hypothetical protein I7I50_06245 [Histoplasma capsulatum G186AR]
MRLAERIASSPPLGSHYSENTQDHDGTPPPIISLYRFLFASARETFSFLRLAPDVKALGFVNARISNLAYKNYLPPYLYGCLLLR